MTFLFDENMPICLAKVIQVLDVDNEYKKPPVHKIDHITEHYKAGADDPDVVRKAKSLKAIIVSQDDDYKNISATFELVKKLKVGYVLFKTTQKSGSLYNDIVIAFIKAWQRVKNAISEDKPPFMYIIERTGEISKKERFNR